MVDEEYGEKETHDRPAVYTAAGIVETWRSHMRKAFYLIVPLLAVVLAWTGCGGNGDGSSKVYDDPDQTIEVKVGEEFVIALDSNATTGYAWQLATPLDEDIVTLVGSDYVPEPGAENREGAGGVEDWTFKAAGAGETTIELEYVRSWEEETEASGATVFKVQVK